MKVEGSYAPKGNWVARNLRLVNDDSKELFPKTPADAKAARFRTMYKEDFHEFPTEVLLEGLATKVSQCTGGEEGRAGGGRGGQAVGMCVCVCVCVCVSVLQWLTMSQKT